ncbi:DUF4232 domain-containing protein [Streptomyces sp. NPDC088785]|uniref:DUF4232 domain-containing protein n=1 Tax=Streptomyces sp. NPDC088785 TaxID=3365897 RepID=UPI0038283C03
MTIRGRAALARAVGCLATALLAAGCATQVSGAGGPASPARPSGGATGTGRVHADPLDSGPPPYGKAGTAPPATAPEAGSCTGSGVHAAIGSGEAAMGLRVVRLTLTNCGTGPVTLSGYPRLRLAEADGTPVEEVRVLHGTGQITSGLADAGPRRLTLRRGESAVSVLAWRNTYTDTTHPPVTVGRVTVDTGTGATRTVTPDPPLDLGSTGRLGTTAWREG